MRSWLYNLIISTTSITDLIPAPAWHSSGDIDPAAEQLAKPFGVIRFLDESSAFTRMSGSPVSQIAQMWVHDVPGSMLLHDAVIKELKDLLTAKDLVPYRDGSGLVIIDIEWNGVSADLYDDGFNTNTRYGACTITGRQ
jgi:hypothetical protein